MGRGCGEGVAFWGEGDGDEVFGGGGVVEVVCEGELGYAVVVGGGVGVSVLGGGGEEVEDAGVYLEPFK